MRGQEQWAAPSSSHDLSTAVTAVLARQRVLSSPGPRCVPRTGGAEGDVEPGLLAPTLGRCQADRSLERLARGASSVSQCIDLARWCIGLIRLRGRRAAHGQQELFACLSTIFGSGPAIDTLRCQTTA
ncbi:hypothetical protein ADK67_03625 [Saccharothrix sp. NRRL B-16348]|nr:hypothetical protein ADK67_03625 [Saccharothrix sp. NRRL B-16348]